VLFVNVMDHVSQIAQLTTAVCDVVFIAFLFSYFPGHPFCLLLRV
jgi:hypothetical protein